MINFLKRLFTRNPKLTLPRDYYFTPFHPASAFHPRRTYKILGFNNDGINNVEESDYYDSVLTGSLTTKNNHRPVLDFDFPCQLIESSTLGHYHFYIDTPMTWRRYYKLLVAMEKAGLIQKKFLAIARKNKQTMVFLPHIKKIKLLAEGKIKGGSAK